LFLLVFFGIRSFFRGLQIWKLRNSYVVEVGRLFVAKMVEDVKKNYSARNVFSFISYKLLGGKPEVSFHVLFFFRGALFCGAFLRGSFFL
jgi:hypothetical protein